MTVSPWRCAVLSGKGGTGKTSVTVALAQALKGSLVLGDADVDAPNLSLALDVHREETFPFFGLPGAHMDREGCTGCGACVEACRFSALELRAGHVRVDDHRCEGCGVCVFVCPEKILRLAPRQQGTFFRGSSPEGPFWGARLRPGGENSGKLVQILLEHATQDARRRHLPLLLVDGPPGTSCPAASTLGGADLALLVAEPTPSGEHDLERMGHLCRRFGIPSVVVANRADITHRGTSGVEACARRIGGLFLGSIPFLPEIPSILARRGHLFPLMEPFLLPLLDHIRSHLSAPRGN